jgi:ABC-2 type transport system ATP-binding protein
MPQDGLALNNLTVGEALYFTAHLRGLPRPAARTERDALLDRWQLGPQRDQPIPRLSGGQRRLLQIAIAMAGSPPVLILDEPTANLDPQRRKRVWEVLREQNQAHGTTIIFITHDAVEAEKVIDRVAILRAGELVALGRPLDLKRQVDHQLRLELFFPPDDPPPLPPDLLRRELAPGRWLVYLDRPQAAAILQTLDLARLDDFRLYSATLEDLYLYYATHA